jgi:hypothetical protein
MRYMLSFSSAVNKIRILKKYEDECKKSYFIMTCRLQRGEEV